MWESLDEIVGVEEWNRAMVAGFDEINFGEGFLFVGTKNEVDAIEFEAACDNVERLVGEAIENCSEALPGRGFEDD